MRVTFPSRRFERHPISEIFLLCLLAMKSDFLIQFVAKTAAGE
jgi:hypothetical protein